MSGSLSSLPVAQQIEALYIAYFGRAADAGGYVYWFNQFTAQTGGDAGGGQGVASTQAVVNIAESFGVQPEATALYSFLATPPAIPIADPSSPPSDVQPLGRYLPHRSLPKYVQPRAGRSGGGILVNANSERCDLCRSGHL